RPEVAEVPRGSERVRAPEPAGGEDVSRPGLMDRELSPREALVRALAVELGIDAIDERAQRLTRRAEDRGVGRVHLRGAGAEDRRRDRFAVVVVETDPPPVSGVPVRGVGIVE